MRDLHKIADGEGVAFEVFEAEEGVKGALHVADGDGVGGEWNGQSPETGKKEGKAIDQDEGNSRAPMRRLME